MKKTLALMLLLAGLTMNAQAETLIWNGSEGHMTWDWNEYNWLTTDGSPSQYQDSCDLEFGDTGSGAVALDCFPSPASVLVNSDKDYTFTGDWFLGDALLTKSGKGTLTINSNGNEIDILVKEGTLVLGCEYAIKGSVTIAGGTLVLGSDGALAFAPNVTLNGGTLDLGGNTFSSDDSPFILKGNTNSIGNGTFEGELTVPYNSTLTLCGDLGGSGRLVLSGDSTLNLGGHTLTKKPDARGHTTISHGKIVLDREWDLLGAVLEDVTLDLNGNTTYFYHPDSLKGSCSIGNGTIKGDSLCVERDNTLTLFGITSIDGVTITAGNTTVKALKEDTPGLLQELTVSEGLIAGTDRQTSRADGLEITSESDLMIKSMTITANNSISVGENIITLQDVTIDLPQYDYDLEKGIFYFDLKSLINCDLVMKNVLLDASDLTPSEAFDPANTSVVFDFGDDVSIKQATGLDMRLGNYWSTSLNLDQQGKVIFTKLVDTPEPATGTLSLLALAALCMRKRRK